MRKGERPFGRSGRVSSRESEERAIDSQIFRSGFGSGSVTTFTVKNVIKHLFGFSKEHISDDGGGIVEKREYENW